MPEYYVTKADQCQRCKGSGFVTHPVWQRYWQEYARRFPDGAPTSFAETDFDDAFWRSEGYEDRRSIPDEEEPCPECEGQGHIETRVRLEQALLILLPWVLGEIERREQLAREEADAAALLEDLEQGEVEGYGEEER